MPAPEGLPPSHPSPDFVPPPSLVADQTKHILDTSTAMGRGALSALGGLECPRRILEELELCTGSTHRNWGRLVHHKSSEPKPLQLAALRTRSSQDKSCDWNSKLSPEEFQHFQPSLPPQGCPGRACFSCAFCTHPSSSASPWVCPPPLCGTRNQCQLQKSCPPDSPEAPR